VWDDCFIPRRKCFDADQSKFYSDGTAQPTCEHADEPTPFQSFARGERGAGS